MAKSIKAQKPAFGSTKMLQLKGWDDLQDINAPIEVERIPEKGKETEFVETTQKVAEPITTAKEKKHNNSIVGDKKKEFRIEKNNSFTATKKEKGILFNTEKKIVDRFYELCPKFYLKLSLQGKFQNFSFVISYILKAMQEDYIKKYGLIIVPNDEDFAFYKLSTTKGIPGDVNDEIITKTKLYIKMSEEDYNLFFSLLNTCFRNKKIKPGRYSVNYFFFEITRFFEDNIKYFK